MLDDNADGVSRVATRVDMVYLTIVGVTAGEPVGAKEKVMVFRLDGFMSLLNVASTNLPSPGAPAVLVLTDGLPFVGLVAMTVGASG